MKISVRFGYIILDASVEFKFYTAKVTSDMRVEKKVFKKLTFFLF